MPYFTDSIQVLENLITNNIQSLERFINENKKIWTDKNTVLKQYLDNSQLWKCIMFFIYSSVNAHLG